MIGSLTSFSIILKTVNHLSLKSSVFVGILQVLKI